MAKIRVSDNSVRLVERGVVSYIEASVDKPSEMTLSKIIEENTLYEVILPTLAKKYD